MYFCLRELLCRAFACGVAIYYIPPRRIFPRPSGKVAVCPRLFRSRPKECGRIGREGYVFCHTAVALALDFCQLDVVGMFPALS